MLRENYVSHLQAIHRDAMIVSYFCLYQAVIGSKCAKSKTKFVLYLAMFPDNYVSHLQAIHRDAMIVSYFCWYQAMIGPKCAKSKTKFVLYLAMFPDNCVSHLQAMSKNKGLLFLLISSNGGIQRCQQSVVFYLATFRENYLFCLRVIGKENCKLFTLEKRKIKTQHTHWLITAVFHLLKCTCFKRVSNHSPSDNSIR